MTEKDHLSHEQSLQALCDTITEHGWKECAQTVTGYLEFVADLCALRLLPSTEILKFRANTQIIINILLALQDGPHEEEVRRLADAAKAFNSAQESVRTDCPSDDGSELWSLAEVMAWRQYLDHARRALEACCLAWRMGHLDVVAKEHREPALRCIEEIESRIKLLCSGRLADLPMQKAALEQGALLNAKLTVYADHSKSLRIYSSSIVGPAKDEADAFQKMAAFSTAVIGNDLSGQKDWLQQVDSVQFVRAESFRLASLYDRDGQLDSTGKVIRERAFLDPLYSDTEDFDEPPELTRAAFEMVEHPDVHVEIENLDATLKTAGLNPSQRRALVMRRNGEIMSRDDVNEWKRGQRAISRNRSSLVAAITAATKKQVIKAPMISAGSFSGVIREGAGYGRRLPDEDKPAENLPGPNSQGPRWFDSTPPPIRRSDRKKKHLFKKVST